MEKPNILLIFTDQHAKSSLGAYGSKICQTPNLDHLAEGSVVFDNAYTTCPVCSPARASLQTGLYPFKHGMITNIFMPGCMVHELADSPRLLSRQLQRAGYSPGYTGKWHLGFGNRFYEDDYYNDHVFELDRFRDFIEYPGEYLNASGLPTALGYVGDDFPGHGAGGHIYPEYLEYLRRIGKEHSAEDVAEYCHIVQSDDDTTMDYFLVERSKEIISELSGRDGPWFHMLNFWGPHEPYYPPQRYLDMYEDADIEPWPSYNEEQSGKPKIHAAKRPGKDWEYFRQQLLFYYAYTSYIDEQIGRMCDYLKESGQWDNTIIIFSADHGDSMGIHGGLVDKSMHLYEETVSIPLFVRLPGESPSGREKYFVNTTDIYATILDIAGCGDEAEKRHGRSFMPLVEGKEVPDWPETVVVESSGLGPALHTSRMIRRGDIKYVFNCGSIDELYNLAEDPGEMNNLAGNPDAAEALAEMRQLLGNWLEEKGDPLYLQYPDIIRSAT